MSYQGTKRSKSCRIYEYFNEEMAKIRPKKTGSDYTLHPIGSYAMHFKEISEIVGCAVKYVVFRSGENVTWKNSNQLLHSDSPYYYPNAIGMKTGTTALAGKCLMAVAEIEGKTYIAVVSGCSSEENRYSSALSLFEIIAPI